MSALLRRVPACSRHLQHTVAVRRTLLTLACESHNLQHIAGARITPNAAERAANTPAPYASAGAAVAPSPFVMVQNTTSSHLLMPGVVGVPGVAAPPLGAELSGGSGSGASEGTFMQMLMGQNSSGTNSIGLDFEGSLPLVDYGATATAAAAGAAHGDKQAGGRQRQAAKAAKPRISKSKETMNWEKTEKEKNSVSFLLLLEGYHFSGCVLCRRRRSQRHLPSCHALLPLLAACCCCRRRSANWSAKLRSRGASWTPSSKKTWRCSAARWC